MHAQCQKLQSGDNRRLYAMGANYKWTYFRLSTQDFNMVGGYMGDTQKKHKTVIIGGWALARDNMVPVISELSGSYLVCV